MKITREELAQMFDHSLLQAYVTKEDFIKHCQDCRDNGFGMAAINSYPVKQCKKLLEGSSVNVGAAIAFPLGQMTIESKVFETKQAIADGADEIDYVINITEAKAGNWDYITREMSEIVAVCRAHNVISKVIFENCYLTKEQITKLSEIAKEVRPDFVKTSTGFGPSGATVEDVALMYSIVKGNCQVKAAGAVRDWPTCKKMLEAGATRIGTSSSFAILAGFDADDNK